MHSSKQTETTDANSSANADSSVDVDHVILSWSTLCIGPVKDDMSEYISSCRVVPSHLALRRVIPLYPHSFRHETLDMMLGSTKVADILHKTVTGGLILTTAFALVDVTRGFSVLVKRNIDRRAETAAALKPSDADPKD